MGLIRVQFLSSTILAAANQLLLVRAKHKELAMTTTFLSIGRQMNQVRFRFQRIFVLAAGIFYGLASCGECGVPLLIQIQSKPVRAAWAEIDQIIRENEKLESPTAEPYLVRAEIWLKAGSHEDALRDYLTATDLLVKNQSNPAEHSAHLTRLRTALDQLVQQPRPHFPNEAQQEFASGTVAFRANRLAEAVWSFEECCRLDSNVPIFHVYRGLTYKKLGRTKDAEREVAVAVSLMRYPGTNTKRELSNINLHLESVQGPLRNWLNEALTLRPTPMNFR